MCYDKRRMRTHFAGEQTLCIASLRGARFARIVTADWEEDSVGDPIMRPTY
jgi:hypothetical protein